MANVYTNPSRDLVKSVKDVHGGGGGRGLRVLKNHIRGGSTAFHYCITDVCV